MARPADAALDRHRARRELLVTLLLVVAAVGTSWSSYQAARLHGEQATATGRTNAIRIDAARAAALGQDQTQVDVATFIAWADADRQRDEELADFYVARFRPEFRTAFDAWIATDPFVNPEAAPTPFATDAYKVAAKTTAAELDVAATASAAEVSTNIQHASNYVLSVVLYSIVLFFAGMSIKVESRRVGVTMTSVGYAVLIATIVWIATFPVSVAI
jgi:hypothetical protein